MDTSTSSKIVQGLLVFLITILLADTSVLYNFSFFKHGLTVSFRIDLWISTLKTFNAPVDYTTSIGLEPLPFSDPEGRVGKKVDKAPRIMGLQVYGRLILTQRQISSWSGETITQLATFCKRGDFKLSSEDGVLLLLDDDHSKGYEDQEAISASICFSKKF